MRSKLSEQHFSKHSMWFVSTSTCSPQGEENIYTFIFKIPFKKKQTKKASSATYFWVGSHQLRSTAIYCMSIQIIAHGQASDQHHWQHHWNPPPCCNSGPPTDLKRNRSPDPSGAVALLTSAASRASGQPADASVARKSEEEQRTEGWWGLKEKQGLCVVAAWYHSQLSLGVCFFLSIRGWTDGGQSQWRGVSRKYFVSSSYIFYY